MALFGAQFLGGLGADGQGMNRILKGIAQCCIDHAVPCNPRLTAKTFRHDMHGEMTATMTLHPGVPGMLRGLVLNL